jgi:transposase
MEHTGIYNNHLLSALQSLKANIWLENPTHIKYSLGLQRGKNDCLDAKRIALYAYKNKDDMKLWTSPREVIIKLKKLNTLRDRIVAARKMLSTLVNEEKEFVDKATYKLLCGHTQKSQKALKDDLAKINKTIISLIREDEQLCKLFEEIASVPGVGQVTATELIVATCGSRLKPVVRLNSKTFPQLNR